MNTAPDDRVLPFTQIIAASVVVVLFLAFLALYIEPDHTDVDFAWTIAPRTTAILIGAGYTAGAYFFIRLLTDRRWHRVQAGFLPITAFTICMLAATILHWSRFHQGTIQFILWTVIYILTPFVVPLVWWLNRRTASTSVEEKDLRFREPVRRALQAIGAAGILAFVVVFVQPSILIALAPWKLTALTARVFAGWSILTFATVLSIGIDGRWSATRILMESAMVGLLLTLLGLPRIWGDLDPGKPMTYAFVGGIVVTSIVFLFIHARLDRLSSVQ
ncbi:MAG TPA: hypothetical protein VF898_02000 [Chloroflexota bacterium]